MAVDILLIDPAGAATHVPNVGLGYICGSLRRHNLTARVVDLNLRRDDPQRYLALSRKCALIGISVKANVYRQALEIAEHIKADSPGVPVVLGGPHISIVGERVMAENPSIDFCIKGEAEESLPALFAALDQGDKSHIQGLLWKKGGVIKANVRGHHESLDDLEFPEYSDFDSFEIIAQGFSGSTGLTYPLITSRGCPYRCIYCSVGMVMGRRFRARSPQNCLAELKKAQERFGTKSFMVLDDTFSQDIERASEFCRLLIDKDLASSWMCPNGVRADHFTRKLARLMKRAGCRLVTFGVESSDPKVLAGVKKGVKIEKIEEAVRIAKAEGFEVNCFFIVGLPGATIETDYASLNWVLRHGVRASFWMLVPYEGTALWDMKTGRMLDDYTRGSTFGPDAHVVYETDDYPAEERREFFCVGNYLSPGGRWIPQESFPGGRFKFSVYVLKKSLARSPRLGLRVLAGVLADSVRALRRLGAAVLKIKEEKTDG
jgi:anaerobic magnesium-protoporphyrin IX monomethyl ester cyclase